MAAPGEAHSSGKRELHEEFYAFLNSDRSEEGLSPEEVSHQRGKRYVELHARLTRLFAWRGCHEPEMQADRALDRAREKWAQGRDSGEALPGPNPNPVTYVCSFVRFIFLEWLAERHRLELPVPQGRPDAQEVALECLDRCLEEMLEPEERELILEYYREEKRAKIDYRNAIARRHHLSANALRIECCRIRRRLRTCVVQCVNRKRPETIPQFAAYSSGD